MQKVVIDYKTCYLESLISSMGKDDLRILDMGSGTSKDWVELLKNHSNVHYTALEFDKKSIAKAKSLIGGFPNVTFVSDFGENVVDTFQNQFDLVISLSVLEHVKHLDTFLKASIKAIKPNGTLVHRYDLGHALHAERISERFKIFLCRHFPALMSSRNFTTHPDKKHIIQTLVENGIENIQVQQHQIPHLKRLVDILKRETAHQDLIRSVIGFEEDLYSAVQHAAMPSHQIDFYFPTITIRGTKKA